MPNTPTRIPSLQDPSAAAVLNKVINDIGNRLDVLTNTASTKRISVQSSLDFGTISGQSSGNTVVNILGASTDLVATANPLLTLGSIHLIWSAYVSAANQVTVKVCNPTSSPIAVNTVRWNILVH